MSFLRSWIAWGKFSRWNFSFLKNSQVQINYTIFNPLTLQCATHNWLSQALAFVLVLTLTPSNETDHVSTYQYSNMAPWVSGETSIFDVAFFVSKSLLGIERQKKLKRFTTLTQKPQSYSMLQYWYIERGLLPSDTFLTSTGEKDLFDDTELGVMSSLEPEICTKLLRMSVKLWATFSLTYMWLFHGKM